MYQNNLTILVAIESFFDGGAEIFAIRLANALAGRHKVFLFELEPLDSTGKSQLSLVNTNQIEIFQCGNNILNRALKWKVWNKPGFLSVRKHLDRLNRQLKKNEAIRFIHQHNINVVNSHSWFTDAFFAEIKAACGFRLYASMHGHYEFLAFRNDFEVRTRLAAKQVDRFIYLSQRHLQTLGRFDVDPAKLVRIFYGLEFERCSTVTAYSGGVLKMVMTARGIAEKGWEQLLLATKQLLEKYPGQLQLQLVGDGPFLTDMESRFAGEHIRFLGYRSDVNALVADAHLCLLPSYYKAESLPNSVIEYLALGKPVITTRVGAIEDMVTTSQGVAGQLLNLYNGKPQVSDLIFAIEQYLVQPQLVQQHSILAMEASQKFTMAECLKNYSQLFAA